MRNLFFAIFAMMIFSSLPAIAEQDLSDKADTVYTSAHEITLAHDEDITITGGGIVWMKLNVEGSGFLKLRLIGEQISSARMDVYDENAELLGRAEEVDGAQEVKVDARVIYTYYIRLSGQRIKGIARLKLSSELEPPPPDYEVPADAVSLQFNVPTKGHVTSIENKWFKLSIPKSAQGKYVVVDLEGKNQDADIDLVMTDMKGYQLSGSSSQYRFERVFSEIPEDRKVALNVFVYQPAGEEAQKTLESDFVFRAYTMAQPPIGPFAPNLPTSFTEIEPEQKMSGMIQGNSVWYHYYIGDTGTLQINFEGEGLQIEVLADDGSSIFEGRAEAEQMNIDCDANQYSHFYLNVSGSGQYSFTGHLLSTPAALEDNGSLDENINSDNAGEIETEENIPSPDEKIIPTLTILFNKSDAERFEIISPLSSFCIGPSGKIIIISKGNIFDLVSKSFLTNTGKVEDCVYSPDGALLAICGKKLGYYAGGNIQEELTLPSAEMNMAAGDKGLFLFGGKGWSAKSLYFIERSRGYTKICDMPSSIKSAAVNGDTLFFSVENDIYRLAFGKEISLVVRVPGPAITSLAVSNDGTVFFLAGRTLYSYKNATANLIAENIGDIIRWHNSGLYILDTKNISLLRFENFE